MKGKLDNGQNRSQAAFMPNEISTSRLSLQRTAPYTNDREIKLYLEEWIYFPGIFISVEMTLVAWQPEAHITHA